MKQQERARASISKSKKAGAEREKECGFTLIETTIALVIMMVAALGAASLFAYAVYNNTGGYDRAQTLAVAQQALERLRNARFSQTVTDPILAATPLPPVPQNITREGRPYTVVATITDTTPTLKTITITVTPRGAGQSWATGAGGAVTVVTQRSRSDLP